MYARPRDAPQTMLPQCSVNGSGAVARAFILRLLECILHAIIADREDKALAVRGHTFEFQRALFGRDYGRSHT